MSMDRCGNCSIAIDTDEDMDCYRLADDPKRMWGDDGDFRPENICLCERCRAEMRLDD